jgi:hypothetical protein
MLIIGQPDKMHREQRNSKRRRELFAKQMEILVRGENYNVLNSVFSLCISESLSKVQERAKSLLHFSHSLHLLQRQP